MSDRTTNYDTESALITTAKKLQGVLKAMETGEEGSHPSIVSDIARISTALTTTCAELRQCAKARAREISTIPIDQIIAFLRTFSDERRADIAREITGADDGEGLL